MSVWIPIPKKGSADGEDSPFSGISLVLQRYFPQKVILSDRRPVLSPWSSGTVPCTCRTGQVPNGPVRCPRTKGKGLRTGSFGELGTPPRFSRRTFYPPSAAVVVGAAAGRRALCPEPIEGAFACAEATVGYNWDGPSVPYEQIGGQTSIQSV